MTNMARPQMLEAEPRSPALDRRYARGALALLTLVYVFNFLDRQILNILAELIKHDLNLTDTQLGIVTGLAFALFYSLLGLPIARYAERGDRPRLIAAALAIWSAFTIACGMASNFAHLLIARLGVGIGEAGGVPPSHSLISEFTSRERRAATLAIYSVGLPLGSFIGLSFGGWAGDHLGWRLAFILAGLPGLLLAAVCYAYLREPRRTAPVPTELRTAMVPTVRRILRKRAFVGMAAGGALQAVVLYGIGAFTAPFFMRSHGAELAGIADGFGLSATGLLGIALGIAFGLCGAAGTFAGGMLADRLNRGHHRGYAVVPALAALVSVPLYLGAFASISAVTAFVLLCGASAMVNAYFGPMHATNQSLVAPSERATISALTLVIVNLIGLGIGPPLVGMLSDYGHTTIGLSEADGLRLAMAIVAFVSLLAAVGFAYARSAIDRELES